MDAAVAGLIGAGIGAVAGTAGTVITTLSTRRGERSKWKRDARLQAYSEFLAASHRHYGTLLRAWDNPVDDVALLAVDANAAKVDMYRAKSVLRVIGSVEVHDVADKLMDAQEALTDVVSQAPHVQRRT